MKKDYYLVLVEFSVLDSGDYILNLKFRSRVELLRVYNKLLNFEPTYPLEKVILGSRKRSYKRFPVIKWFPREINFKLTNIEYNRFDSSRQSLSFAFNHDNIKCNLIELDEVLRGLDIISIKALSLGDEWLGSDWSLANYLDFI